MIGLYTCVATDSTTEIACRHDRPASLHPGARVDTVAAAPLAVVRSSDVPAGAAQGDGFMVADNADPDVAWRYVVRAILPDGTGMTTLELEAA